MRARALFSEAETKHKLGTMLDADYSRAMLE
ncbi:MAG: hypothetical protein EBZ51_12295, partial [Synechococcaceae bacterium WB9_2_112]|nr:hypothetical protein [Synechococcaceae bacterium WB9_2_112]